MKLISRIRQHSNRYTCLSVILLLMIQAGLLAYSATRHSPTLNEPGHLVAGLTHWKFGRFEVYRVNPPLVHFIAAIPVMMAGFEEDWGGFYDSPGARPEFKMGEDFIKANGERSLWLFTIARWALIPIPLLGGLFCFFWSRELWQSNLAGLISLFLWTFEPNILAHAELITPDAAATTFSLGATYFFWRWLKVSTWGRAAIAGLMLGLAELTKTSWVILFGLWPLLWLFWLWTERRRAKHSISKLDHPVETPLPESGIQPSRLGTFAQLACLFLLSLYILNLAYGFDGSFTPLKKFTFVSKTLTGLEKSGSSGNRLADSLLGEIPIPVPEQYLRGIDLQKKDFEDYGQPSYLRGEWKDGGWWYYYLYGLAVKTPHGTQFLLLLAIFTLLYYRSTEPPRSPDLVVLLTPAITLLVLVSYQMEFNHHVRYVLPVLGFAFVFIGAVAMWWKGVDETESKVRA